MLYNCLKSNNLVNYRKLPLKLSYTVLFNFSSHLAKKKQKEDDQGPTILQGVYMFPNGDKYGEQCFCNCYIGGEVNNMNYLCV